MDANEPLFDKMRREFHLDRYRFAVSQVKEKQYACSVILDAACGTGYGADFLKQLEPKTILGIDISSETVEYANNKYGSASCSFRTCDIMEMSDIEDSLFDVVTSFETIEHIDEPIVFLKNIERVMKDDGTLIISTPNKWGPTKDHKFDYDYDLFRDHLERYFHIQDIFIQNSGCMELWTNRNAPRRIEKANSDVIDMAECFIAVCRKKNVS